MVRSKKSSSDNVDKYYIEMTRLGKTYDAKGDQMSRIFYHMLKSDRSLCEENNLLEDNVSSIKSMSCSCKHLTISFALNTLK